MFFKTEEEYTRFKDSIRKFVVDELDPLSAEIDETDHLPDEAWRKLREKNLLSLTVPEEYGGMGLGASQFFPILEEVAKSHGAFRIIVHLFNTMSVQLMLQFGTEEQKGKYLPRMGKGECVLAFGLTEPDAGSGADIRTTAVREGNNFILNGRKHLITCADIAGAITVFAVTDETRRKQGGITAFLVEPNSPGLTMVNMPQCMGTRGLFEGVLTFKDCVVPADNIVGEIGQGLDIALGVLDQSRLSIAVSCLGLAERFLELSVDRAKERVTFGKPIASRQAVQQMLADMATDIHALKLMTIDASRKYDQGIDIRTEASMTKLFGMEAIRKISDKALEIYGGIGYTKAYPIERMYRDARCFGLEEGTPTIQRLVIARNVLQG